MNKNKTKKIITQIINLLAGLTYKEIDDLLQQVKDKIYEEQKIVKI